MKTQLLTLLLLVASASASAHTAQEMAFTCPIGGEKFTQTMDTSGTRIGMMTDTRPVGPIATPFSLAQCPSNKFVMFKKEFSPDELAKFERVVNSAEYQQIAAQSPSYLAWGRMMELAGENQDAQQMMNIFLQASWQSESQESFSKTLEYADKVLANKAISSKDAINTQFLRGEMLRKLGRFDEAKRVFTALQKNPEVKKDKLFSQLAALQLSLVAKKSIVSEIIDFDKK
ncbi:tetratricopeptide repeat protein [Kingella sp. (in: b-proteobacteria)]|uniref:tetratricopeptide repeat protein n=1 Tax=Kingella sp. (in: b-proteobacteria) TaxID=2020713 RepID=UPI0026DADF9A|nr:tetratricopeptide repeat protein [Kingella sp. (in: b-proteobacteria)]MDO4657816.1 tetratricopeptide repeat protein [Kingella sp. (in: b-proteobacteria)]